MPIASENSPLPVLLRNTMPNGGVRTEQLDHVIASNAIYGFIPANFRTFTAGAGTAASVNRMFKVSSGTSQGDYGTLQSFRSVNYHTGGTNVFNASGYFGTPQANSWSGMGAITLGEELSFGYNGTDFGVWHRYGGRAEVRTLTVTGAAGGSENATVTVNGTGYTVALTASTVQTNAKEIADYLDANATGFYAEQLNDKVIISAASDGAKSSTWSFSSATATATIAQTTAGVTKTSDHVVQSSWNGRIFHDFDPSKGNNYKIRYSNGYGRIEFLIEDIERNRFVVCHTIEWPNTQTTSNLENPSLRCGVYAVALGTITAVEVYVTDLSGFSTMFSQPIRNPRAVQNTKSISTDETNILTIRNKRIYNGYVNQGELSPYILTLTNDGNKGAIFRIYGNTTLGGTPNYQDVGTNLMSEKEVAGTTVSGGTLLGAFAVGRLSSETIDLAALAIRMPPTLRLTITGVMTSGSAADLSAAIVFYEDYL